MQLTDDLHPRQIHGVLESSAGHLDIGDLAEIENDRSVEFGAAAEKNSLSS